MPIGDVSTDREAPRQRPAASFRVDLALLSLSLGLGLLAAAASVRGEESNGPQEPYAREVLADAPVAWWRLDDSAGPTVANGATQGGSPARLDGSLRAGVKLAEPGPRPGEKQSGYVDFAADNRAARFDGRGGRVVVPDPGAASRLDFEAGDSITLEAWVELQSIGGGQNVYIVGKGRTGRPGAQHDNQNYALRLRSVGGTARISFLFRDADNRPPGHPEYQRDWHRWTSDVGFPAGSGWHHVAVSYTFNEGASLRGYLDGAPVAGRWDMGGRSDEAPVVDDDELWIGSALGGGAGNSFNGRIDEVAIYRAALGAERIAARYRHVAPPPLAAADLPPGEVLVEILEGIGDVKSWDFPRPTVSETHRQAALAFAGLPRKYTRRAIIADRSPAFLIRAAARIELPEGELRLLLRSLGGARLSVDGRVLATTPFLRQNGGGHESVPEAAEQVAPGVRPLPPGHHEQPATFRGDGRPHVVVLETVVGGSKVRPEVGELSVSIEGPDGAFRILSPRTDLDVRLTDDDWDTFSDSERARLAELNARLRRERGAEEAAWWDRRHALARAIVEAEPPPPRPDVPPETPLLSPVDHFIGARLAAEKIEAAPLADDHTFLRRLTLDTVGVVPTPAEIETYLHDPPDQRRARAIERLLADPRWADHWVGYWQDVLAENPGILKPKLNNTGPFRWWIYESLLDNKPLDRFATELVRMEGSTYYGGPAGFAMATENDVPMAAKAHVVAQAFLAVEMKCARCHDAPFHDVKQQDLFNLAAMLGREPQKVPTTSSIPLSPEERKDLLVEVTLEPGTDVQPAWPFAELAEDDAGKLPEGAVRDADDPREQLAAMLTWPTNRRFARVMVNRLWQRYLGRGMVEPVDDWEEVEPSHPELLDYLARELVVHDYDLKHVARLILGSHAYQRAVVADKSPASGPARNLFASPARRRLTAEQLLDSLFVVAEKPLECEPLTMDVDGRRPVDTFLNLGRVERAWQLTSLSNERDRPALAFPRAQGLVDLLKTFGWRESRQNPQSTRDDTPTVQQPALLANGLIPRHVWRLSDDNGLTRICLTAESPERLVRQLCLQILARPPRAEETRLLVGKLGPGFADRVVADAAPAARRSSRQLNVSWSNHLSPEATRLKQELERQVREGPPPTGRLQADWRERAEDAIWALINSPEFVFVP